MVTTCPGSAGNSETNTKTWDISDDLRTKCENVNPSDAQQMLPVSARDTKITYRNIYCAQCNEVNTTNPNEFSRWKSLIKCSNGMRQLLSGNPDSLEIYRRLSSEEEVAKTGCKMKYIASEMRVYDRKCMLFDNHIINRCNQTGKWNFYDVRLDRACKMYTSLVFDKYKNLFCFLCNIDYHMRLGDLAMKADPNSEQAHTARISFEALFDFSDTYITMDEEVEEAEEVLCKEHQIYDNITCQCLDLMCTKGKRISSNKNTSNCTTAFLTNYLGYRICFQVELEFNKNVFDVQPILNEMASRVHSSWHPNPITLRSSVKAWCPGDNKISFNFEALDFYQFGTITMEDYDQRAINMIKNMKESSKYWFLDGLKSHVITLKTNCPSDFRNRNPCFMNKSLEASGLQWDYPLVERLENIEGNVDFLHFRMTNLCPHVDVPANEFERVNNSVIHVAAQFKLDIDQIDELNETMFRVCKDVYLDILSSVDKSSCSKSNSQTDLDDFDTWSVAGLVSIVCTCLSLVCLFLTFLTYLIFPSLRDASGKNIMTLTFTLFFAQAFFEFAIEQFENEEACKSFGILIHYFWLAAVFSMNACTVERFYKLCFPLKSRAFFYSNKPFFVAFSYTFISPFFIIATNIILNYETTGKIGYGSSTICYINKLYSRLFAFAFPLAILLLTNLILFAITIYSIRRHSIPGQKSSSTRVGIKACVQLSFVTGLTWTLAFLYEFIPVSSVGYIFTALIGLQGVLFFYSIILNKRVIALYKGLFNLQSEGSSSGKMSGSSNSDGMKVQGGKKNNPVYKITFGKKKFDSTATQSDSLDSGVGII